LRFAASAGHRAADTAEFACTNVHAGDHGPIFWCPDCQLGFSPPPDSDRLLSLYEDVNDPSYLTELENRQRHAQSILRTIEKWHPPGRLLEIGSQVGILLQAAQERGWDASGIEPSRWAVKTGQARFGVKLTHGSVEAAEFPPGSFDCIVMVDVLEHLLDPLAVLQRCRPWLAPGGILALSTVNMGTFIAKVLGTRWPGFMDMHLSYFTTKSLHEFLRRSRFQWIAARPDSRSLSLGYIGGRLENNGPMLRTMGSLGKLPVLKSLRVTLPTRDLLLVVARPI
jgi:2-polyprenyl-3-methyl-5-hydroxy-6-metoxy-1,4-benzoquinol methylase